MAEAIKRYAVVTGANKGIGLEICRQLASNGIVVILTARDEKRGLEAVQKLKESGLSDYVVFHQLDVADISSISSLADFIKTQFGKLDILVNNAGIAGAKVDFIAFRASVLGVNNAGIAEAKGDYDAFRASFLGGAPFNWKEITTDIYELAEECLKINYYGAKKVAEALILLLQLSDSPKIVNVSSAAGQLKNVSNKWATEVLGDAENLTQERVDEVLNQYLKDFKEGFLETKGWPGFSAYILSKAAMNAYTRILAKKYPNFSINCICPGYVKTDITDNTGILSVEEGAESPVWLALMPNGGPSGCYFIRKEKAPF